MGMGGARFQKPATDGFNEIGRQRPEVFLVTVNSAEDYCARYGIEERYALIGASEFSVSVCVYKWYIGSEV